MALPRSDPAIVARAVASLLRLAEADLKDAELLSSGRNAGNAPGLLQLAADRLVQAVLATEFGWPLPRPEPSPASIADENPLKGRLTEITKASPWAGTPVVSGTGAPPDPPDKQDIRAGIRIARGILKLVANEFAVDLFGDALRRPPGGPSSATHEDRRSNVRRRNTDRTDAAA